MKFSDLDRCMRVFETAHDHRVLPGLFMVARLDGRAFTRLTRELHHFDHPFDERFRDMMLGTAEHLMSCGFRVLYAHTQSDEISLLFHPLEAAFGRKVRKYISVLAGEASAAFTRLMGDIAAFDCRLSQLPTADRVVDYFQWRAEDAHRNALNAHCYWALVGDGTAPQRASDRLDRLSVGDRNELLLVHGINFNDLPAWQKRGAGLWWQPHEQTGRNPVSGEPVTYSRQRLHRELELPRGQAYATFIRALLESALSDDGANLPQRSGSAFSAALSSTESGM